MELTNVEVFDEMEKKPFLTEEEEIDFIKWKESKIFTGAKEYIDDDINLDNLNENSSNSSFIQTKP